MGKMVRELGHKKAGESDPPVPLHYRNKLLWFLYVLHSIHIIIHCLCTNYRHIFLLNFSISIDLLIVSTFMIL